MRDKKEKDIRFEEIYKEGSSLGAKGIFKIIVDKDTGVQYLLHLTGYGSSITPLLDSEGKPIVKK